MKKYLAGLMAIALPLLAGAEAKYIFYFIGDGMGLGHVNTTQTYLRDVKKSEEPLLMTTFPVASHARTYSFDSPITDSAAAGTALSTGHKTVNSRIAMSPDSLNLRSLTSDLLEAGYAVGVATSVAGDDATPAAFYAHALGRTQSLDIAPWAIGSGLSFLAGGNFKINHKETAEEGRAWLEKMQGEGGYTLVTSFEELTEGKGKKKDKILFIPEFNTFDQIGYTLDSIPGATPLAEITAAAIETLQRANTGKFFLMAEGGNIDWAAHANDGATVIKEIINFQESIGLAYDFYLRHPKETLIVVTADHDTGGMALGREDNRKSPDLALIDLQRISKDRLNNIIEERLDSGGDFSWEEMEGLLRERFGFWESFPLSDGETLALKKAFEETFEMRSAKDTKTWYQSFKHFVVDLYDLVNRRYGIGWTTSSHTGNLVPVYAIGEGADLFSREMENTEIPRLILSASH